MAELKSRTDKYGTHEATKVTRAFHESIRAVVRKKLEAAGGDWNSFVFDRSYELLTAEDFKAVEAEFLRATGHKFDASATISAKESPEKYKPVPQVEVSQGPTSGKTDGRTEVGVGDNVVRYPKNVQGTARFIRTSEIVMDMLINGVPEDTIAVIDDSGGTLTAPILENFKAVICMGGTVRSHLGILTREYGIPCFMNSKLNGLKEGDRVEMEVTATAKSAEDYQEGREVTAKIWKLG